MKEALQEAKRRTASSVKKNPRYESFKKQYRNDPVAFIHDCIEGITPTFYQDEIGVNIVKHRRESVRGPHVIGKTCIASLLVHWYALTRDGEDWKIITTASVWRQLSKYLWPEIHKWARKIRWNKIGRQPYDNRLELQMLSLKLETGEAFAVASDNHEHIEGAHADHIFYIFDEGKAIPNKTWEAAEGALSGTGEAFALAISTPGDPFGVFYDIHSRKRGYDEWHATHITKDDAIKSGRMSLEWAKAKEKLWGSESSIFKNRVEGEFAASDESGIAPLAWIEAANERWYQWVENGRNGKAAVLSSDIAAGGSNKTVVTDLFDRCGEIDLAYSEFDEFDHKNEKRFATARTSARLMERMNIKRHSLGAVVDAVGIGDGVASNISQQFGIEKVIAFKGGTPAVQENHGRSEKIQDGTGTFYFRNLNSLAWYMLHEKLNPDSPIKIALPPKDKLTGDLVNRKYEKRSDGIIEVESKKDMLKRVKAETDEAITSPDDGDTAAMAIYAYYHGFRQNIDSKPNVVYDDMTENEVLGSIGLRKW